MIHILCPIGRWHSRHGFHDSACTSFRFLASHWTLIISPWWPWLRLCVIQIIVFLWALTFSSSLSWLSVYVVQISHEGIGHWYFRYRDPVSVCAWFDLLFPIRCWHSRQNCPGSDGTCIYVLKRIGRWGFTAFFYVKRLWVATVPRCYTVASAEFSCRVSEGTLSTMENL